MRVSINTGFFFFFQAEDGIRDLTVTGVQTCALPIFVHLEELHLDALLPRGRQVLADVVGPDRQLAVAAVDENRELDARRAAVVEQGLEIGRASCRERV